MEQLNLGNIRNELDEIDKQISKLYKKRITICNDVAEYKIGVHKPVLDPEREASKLETLRGLFDEDFDKKAIEELYRQIMTISRRYQYMLMGENEINTDTGFDCIDKLAYDKSDKVVYQGVEGAYSHMAATNYFGKEANMYHVDKFEEAIIEVENGKAKYAVVPIENSKAGSVTDTYDLLAKHNVFIVGEYFQPVSHCLLAIKGSDISDIKTIYSHPQGLMQCSEFLNEHKGWRQISLLNTAVAAKKVLSDNDKTQAAIASDMAGELYGLETLETNINRNIKNTTRFVVLTRDMVYVKQSSKISMVFELPHKSGSLYNTLGNFIFNDLNMIKIESRPIPEKNFEYRFFVDIEGNLSMPRVKNALIAIKNESEEFRILGNY